MEERTGECHRLPANHGQPGERWRDVCWGRAALLSVCHLESLSLMLTQQEESTVVRVFPRLLFIFITSQINTEDLVRSDGLISLALTRSFLSLSRALSRSPFSRSCSLSVSRPLLLSKIQKSFIGIGNMQLHCQNKSETKKKCFLQLKSKSPVVFLAEEGS